MKLQNTAIVTNNINNYIELYVLSFVLVTFYCIFCDKLV